MIKNIEKFTSADVYADNDNDQLIDEGYFTETGFHSTIVNEDCICINRKKHEKHLLELNICRVV